MAHYPFTLFRCQFDPSGGLGGEHGQEGIASIAMFNTPSQSLFFIERAV